jgi:hypothetical protein
MREQDRKSTRWMRTLWLLVLGCAFAGALQASCSVVVATSATQCTIDDDCLRLGPVSRFRRPTCTQGVCEVRECLPPPVTPEQMVSLPFIVLAPDQVDIDNGRVERVTNPLPATSPYITAHACQAQDAVCFRTTCNWLTPSVSGDANGQFALKVSPKFDGYVAILGDPAKLPGIVSTIFYPLPNFREFPKLLNVTALVPRQILLESALLLKVPYLDNRGTVLVQVAEADDLCFSFDKPCFLMPADLSAVMTDTQGVDVLKDSASRRVIADPAAKNIPGASLTVAAGYLSFSNIPEGYYLINVERKAAGRVSSKASARVLVLADVATFVQMQLPADIVGDR